MAKYFQISTPEGVSNLKLDREGCATLQVKAKNVTGAPVDGHANVLSVPATTPPSGAVQNGWIKIEPVDQHFIKDEEKVFVVKVEVRKKDKIQPKAGTYQFKVDVASVTVPDQGDSTSVFAFTVERDVDPKPHPLLWLIPVILLALIGGGVGIYFAMSKPEVAVPPLRGKTLTDAQSVLAGVNLVLDSKFDTSTDPSRVRPEDSGKIVDQSPKDGNVKEGTSVHVTVGAHMVSVPQVWGLDYQAAQKLLSGSDLATGDTTTAPNANFAGGVVWDQTPAVGTTVPSGTAVNMKVTQKSVQLTQSVAGKTLGDAITALRSMNLDIGSLSGDTKGLVISQSPPADGRNVDIGTKIDLAFPNTGACKITGCVYPSLLVQQFAFDLARPKPGPKTQNHEALK